MRVRIDKADLGLWYFNQVGSELKVYENQEGDFVLNGVHLTDKIILKTDCTVLQETDKERKIKLHDLLKDTQICSQCNGVGKVAVARKVEMPAIIQELQKERYCLMVGCTGTCPTENKDCFYLGIMNKQETESEEPVKQFETFTPSSTFTGGHWPKGTSFSVANPEKWTSVTHDMSDVVIPCSDVKIRNERQPFDLTTYNTGKYEVETRDGRKVRILATDLKSADSMVIVITHETGDEYARSYMPTGKNWASDKESNDDLFLIPKQVSKWVNEYESEPFKTKEAAMADSENWAMEMHLGIKYLRTKEIKTNE